MWLLLRVIALKECPRAQRDVVEDQCHPWRGPLDPPITDLRGVHTADALELRGEVQL